MLFSEFKAGDLFSFTDKYGNTGVFQKIDDLEDDECVGGVANAIAVDDAFFPVGETTHFYDDGELTINPVTKQ
jgi:hypothetical protein